MLTSSDLVRYRLSRDTMRIVKEMARKASLGGTSRYRPPVERAVQLSEDQLVGQIGECVLSVHLTGSHDLYVATREKRNEDPWAGDGGSDLTGYPVDVKTSLMRSSRDPLAYNLFVHEKERHKDTVYVLALVPFLEKEPLVYLTGWMPEEGLPENVSNWYKNTYQMKASLLRPVGTLKSSLGVVYEA